jgi:hypothetical protein
MGLSGGMIWAMENDDFKNKCGTGKYPLLHKVHDMLNGNSKDSFECNIEDEATPTPSTPTPTTQSPTTQSPTTQSPVTPSQTTAAPVTPSPTTQPTEGSTGEPKVTAIVDKHIIRCYKSGYISHPTDRHKYIVCEYIAEGPKQGWWIHIMGCGPGTRWHQPTENCIQDDS